MLVEQACKKTPLLDWSPHACGLIVCLKQACLRTLPAVPKAGLKPKPRSPAGKSLGPAQRRPTVSTGHSLSLFTYARLRTPVERPRAASVHSGRVSGSASAEGKKCCTECAADEHWLSHAFSEQMLGVFVALCNPDDNHKFD